ncbi:zona pellucida sperm-binding protein 3-like isoform X2 [Narcine bancroftii]|uniref:zona pellucida sperm-binding protein 3-like isoform X2 n=1 Tax=Narcine bancroftii TaxID=1343680 RepID=UPI0038318A2A
MLLLLSILLSAGAVCPFRWEGQELQRLPWNRAGAAWILDSPPWAGPSSSSSSLPVVAWCGERGLSVLVRLGLLRTERPVRAVVLMLGWTRCPTVWVDTETNVTLFRCHLLDCDLAVMVFVDQLRYSTHLYLVPQDVGSAVEESRVAIASIECHDPRKVNVDWQMGLPRIPLIPLRTKGGLVQSSLRLMNADWTAERTSKIYRWGDFIHVEVSVTISYTPRSVYVDRCEAIPSLVQDFAPRYHLISFNGCLLDSRYAESLSSTLLRPHRGKLQIKLDTFWIPAAQTSISIVCHFKVVPIEAKPDSISKACMFKKPANQWIPVEGPAGICACCNQDNCGGSRRRRSTGFGRKARDVDTKTLLTLAGLAGAVALLLSVLMVGGTVFCGALVIFNLYSKLKKPSAWRRG